MSQNLADELAVRRTLERYMACIDVKDWDGVAACFAPDAESLYNDDPTVLRGGAEVAAFIQRATAAYESTVHDLGNCVIDVDGDRAAVRSRALIGMRHPGSSAITIRAISYDDELVRAGDAWLIRRRTHRPLWQFDAPGTAPRLVM